MKRLTHWISAPPVAGPSANLLIRITAGGIFLSEGILKFIYPSQGVWRFATLGFAFPEVATDVVASAEIMGGLFLLAGLFTHVTCLYFILQMVVAVFVAGTNPWCVLHEALPACTQILLCLFILTEGPGRRSLDFVLFASGKMYRTSRRNRNPSLSEIFNTQSHRDAA
jgi:uncharacterized membrane protein YphA (DoxX/SURF4 family)